MASRGKDETNLLKKNIEDQLDRLVLQLADLEECRDDLDTDEYEETRADTIEQLKEFNESLASMELGNLSLIDNVNAMQLAIQAAISNAFKTPDIIKMFAKKRPIELRQRLDEVERDYNLDKLSLEVRTQQRLEILTALKKLGETLSDAENEYLTANSNLCLVEFERASSTIGYSDSPPVVIVMTSTTP